MNKQFVIYPLGKTAQWLPRGGIYEWTMGGGETVVGYIDVHYLDCGDDVTDV